MVTCLPRAVTSASDRKVFTAVRGRGPAAWPLGVLHKIQGSASAASVAGFVASHTTTPQPNEAPQSRANRTAWGLPLHLRVDMTST